MIRIYELKSLKKDHTESNATDYSEIYDLRSNNYPNNNDQ